MMHMAWKARAHHAESLSVVYFEWKVAAYMMCGVWCKVILFWQLYPINMMSQVRLNMRSPLGRGSLVMPERTFLRPTL